MKAVAAALLLGALAAAPAPAAAQGIFVTRPVFLAQCAGRFTVKAERTKEAAAAAALRRAAEAAKARATSFAYPEIQSAAEAERIAAEMAKFLRERLAADAAFAAELDRSVAQCEGALAAPG